VARKYANQIEQQIPEKQETLRQNILAKFQSGVTPHEDHRWMGFGLTFLVDAKNSFETFKVLKESPEFDFNMLIDVTAVDFLDKKEPRFEVVYQLLSLKYLHRVCLKIQVPEEKPEVESVRPLWNSAFFMEREVWDLYGITFLNHGDLRRIILYDEFVGHPLRKDYPVKGKQPRVNLRIPELRNTAVDLHRDELTLVPLPVRQKPAAEKTHNSDEAV
jgi:NADH-quinone oxidoreductase subunit C